MGGFAVYRLPYAKQATLVRQTEGEPLELSSCQALNGQQGFVIAPFEITPAQPIILIRPDETEVVDLVFSRNVECGMWNENSSAADHSHQGNLIPHSTFHIPQEIIHFNKVTIRYGARTILKDLDWTVRQGEHWALSGDNGSGKSTLLSLVCADNPQAYACDISLFGHKRGSGESIWDIKRHIGYVSPEMHRSYKQNIPAIQIVASGLKDTIGLYVRPNEAEREQCHKWLKVFGIGHLADRKFMEMSSGEQRLVLLARAFVKEPDLLILDEPLHGLDDENRLMVKEIVDKYCEDSSRTLIYVTHYQEELPHCIDHSIFLKKNA